MLKVKLWLRASLWAPRGEGFFQLMSRVLAAGWPVLLGLTGIPSLIQLLTLPFFPESPRYLLIQKGNEEQARRGTVHPSLEGEVGWDGSDCGTWLTARECEILL